LNRISKVDTRIPYSFPLEMLSCESDLSISANAPSSKEMWDLSGGGEWLGLVCAGKVGIWWGLGLEVDFEAHSSIEGRKGKERR
jgi:hypothetical protein